MAKNFENLEIWKESIRIAILIYKTTQNFPREEIYGLTSQLRRAAVSISCNIAEGAGRSSKKEFIRFINIALGSLNETENLSKIALELSYLSLSNYQTIKQRLVTEGKQIGAFKNYLQKS